MSQPFVAREHELGQLDAFLDRALAGQGQVCFVTGEAGSGKTTLISEFAREAQKRHEDLIVAIGQSDAQTGIGDPYLPFRELLCQLTGDVEPRLAQGSISQENAKRLQQFLGISGQALVSLGPDLIGIFVPGAGLATRAATFLAEKAGWLDKLEHLTKRPRRIEVSGSDNIEQSHLFEQYTNVLNKLAEKQPLLVVLDDLQWADSASIGLLFRLGRRIRGSRVLLIGTYRPAEVAVGRAGERHPLEKVQTEFKRYFGDIWIDLDEAKRTKGKYFVDAFLSGEPNQLSEEFNVALHHHTGGNPLFTIELLRAMQERGDLVRDGAGRWIEGVNLDWNKLPARVEGVIEERMGRLEQGLHEALSVASVEGEDFTAETVASVQATAARKLVRRLSGELEKQHHLVSARGTRRLGSNGPRLSLYRFQHNLFQTYLYNNLDEIERAYLHEDMGNALEKLFGDQVDEITVQLARHFVEAGIVEKARTYLRRAGELAAARFANVEAVDNLSRALDLTPETDIHERYILLLARERVLGLLGEREAQERDLNSLKELVEALADGGQQEPRWQAKVALRQAIFAEVTGNFPAAIEAAQTAVCLAQIAQDANLEADSRQVLGSTLSNHGDYEEAKTQIDHAMRLAQQAGLRQVEASCFRNLANISLRQGDHDKAKTYGEHSLKIYRELGDQLGESKMLDILGGLSLSVDDLVSARRYCERSLLIDREIGRKRGECASLGNLGIIFAQQANFVEARKYFEQVLQVSLEINDRASEGRALGNLGNVSMDLGNYAAAKAYLEKAANVLQEVGNWQAASWVHVSLGGLLHLSGNDEEAVQHIRQTLDTISELGIRAVEGTALTNLGHALAKLGNLEDAAKSYQQALLISHELGQPNRGMQCLAGLANVALAQSDLVQAQTQVEEILRHLETKSLDGADEPFLIYLTCYQVLRANRDRRAQDVLNTAYHMLHEQADKIGDKESRHSFLVNVPSHREILREYVQSS